MSEIAFDFDGIFIPDYYHIPGLTMKEFYEQTLHTKPLFNPDFDYDIITARDPQYRYYTFKWMENLPILPLKVFHENTDHKEPWLYKIHVLKKNPSIKVYIESDIEICKKISENKEHNATVIHFDTWIRNQIRNNWGLVQW